MASRRLDFGPPGHVPDAHQRTVRMLVAHAGETRAVWRKSLEGHPGVALATVKLLAGGGGPQPQPSAVSGRGQRLAVRGEEAVFVARTLAAADLFAARDVLQDRVAVSMPVVPQGEGR